jgi:glycosyltransferase involved in cell wall biosynthesis
MSQPEISVCVPTYNGAQYLAETLGCISAQTFEDIEILIVDDGSTDGTLDIAHEFAAVDDRARVIRNEQRAGSSARNANLCVGHARGAWIKFLYQDDLMAPDCLAAMRDAGRAGPLVITRHQYRFEPDVDASTRSAYESLPTLAEKLPGTMASPDEVCDAVLDHWEINFIGPTSSSFIRRDCFERYGLFAPDIATFPDLEYWIRLGSNEGLSIVREPMVTFRVHGKSISASRNDPANPRQYQYSLELLALLCQLKTDPHYERLRIRAQSHPVAPRLAHLFRELAFQARWVAVDTRFRTKTTAQLEYWTQFCETHPVVLEALRDIDAEMSTVSRLKQFVKARF